MTTRFNITEKIAASMQQFAEHMESTTQLKDGCLTARVIGEFSAGKTRLLRELLGDAIPPALFPISSIERQTKLQLEITYGEQPELTLVQREADYQTAVTLSVLDHFPERHEIDEKQYDPRTHRLRLSLPESRLILPQGDGYQEDKSPMRLFLIDTPGWNSGDDDIAEDNAETIMAGYHNLGLVYVTDARRIDGATNTQRLSEFLRVLQEAEFLEGTHLVFVVTQCPLEDQSRLQLRAREMVMKQWQALGNTPQSLTLHVMCVDFGQMAESDRQQFRETFWQHLLAPLGETQTTTVNPWVRRIHHWPAEWDIRPHLAGSAQQLEGIRQLLNRVVVDGEYIKGMNKHRLLGLSDDDCRKRLREVWLRQLGCTSPKEALTGVHSQKPWLSQHPLNDWWTGYWLHNMNEIVGKVSMLFYQFEVALTAYHAGVDNLQQHFASRLEEYLRQAFESLDSSFTRLVQTAQTLCDEPAQEKVLATVLTLSLLEGRYREHYETAKAGLSPVAGGCKV